MSDNTVPRGRDLPTNIYKLTNKGNNRISELNTCSDQYKHKTRDKFDNILHDLIVQQHTINLIEAMAVDSIHPATTTKSNLYMQLGYDAVVIHEDIKIGLELEHTKKSKPTGIRKARKILKGLIKWPRVAMQPESDDEPTTFDTNEYNNFCKNKVKDDLHNTR